MHDSPLIAPVVALVAWTLVMLFWMAFTRLPAMKKAGIGLNRRGGRGANLEGVLPDEVNWKGHNYQHLMEQPTLFYAACFALIVAGWDGLGALYAAWGYVALRVVHSLIQAISNRIRYRFGVFLLASLCLIVLIGYAVCSVFWGE